MDNTFERLLICGVVGGSGSGKTTIAKMLLKHFPELLKFSRSGTTRERENTEKHGDDYFYFPLDVFLQMEREGKFLETNPFATGSRYGTLKSELEEALAEGKILLVDLEINGAVQLYQKYPGKCVFVFLDVSDEEAYRRLSNANTRKREKIPDRIKNLQDQRIRATTEPCIMWFIDTTKLKEEFVFNKVSNIFLQEYRARKEKTTA